MKSQQNSECHKVNKSMKEISSGEYFFLPDVKSSLYLFEKIKMDTKKPNFKGAHLEDPDLHVYKHYKYIWGFTLLSTLYRSYQEG